MLLMINHGIMRIFLSVLILLLSLQSWTKADDIRDFEIEGISIGDSLLDHFSEAEIKNGIRNMNIYSDDSFYDVEIYNLDLSAEFKNLSFSLKKMTNYIKFIMSLASNFMKIMLKTVLIEWTKWQSIFHKN